jgi:hypothetical protein
MLSFKLHTCIGEQDLLLPVMGHIVFTTVAGQGWLAGRNRPLWMRREMYQAKALRSSFIIIWRSATPSKSHEPIAQMPNDWLQKTESWQPLASRS